MRTYLAFGALILVTALTVFDAQPASADSITRPFLYRITIDGKTSYLLGTVHFGVDLKELPESVVKTFDTSRVLVTEVVDTEKQLNDWLYDYVTAILEESSKYHHHGEPLTKEQRNILVTKWKLPTALANIATSQSCGAVEALNLPTVHQMDIQAQLRAYSLKIPLVPLDTVELRERAEAAEGDCDLRYYLQEKSREELLQAFAEQMQLYRAGDESSFWDDSPDIKLRNEAWMPQLLVEIKKGRAFIDVGVGHLFGPNGLVPLLEKAGARVERVQD
jgi:hypothetical protein